MALKGRPWPFVSGSLPFPSLSKNDVSHGGPLLSHVGSWIVGPTLSTKTTERERWRGFFILFLSKRERGRHLVFEVWCICAWESTHYTISFLFFFLPRKKVDIILLHKLVLRALDIISFFRGVTRSHVNNLLLFNLLISQLNKIYSLIKIHFFYLCISLSQW